MKFILSFFLGFFLFNPIILTAQNRTISVLTSKTEPVVDGFLDVNEWSMSNTFEFNQNSLYNTRVMIKKTKDYLYVAFKQLTDSSGTRLNPEILIDTNPSNTLWTNSCFWFHSSHSNCFSVGEYYNWSNCIKNQEGWQANSFPFVNNNNNIEFKISYNKLGINPKKKNVIKIAFKISNIKDQHFYYPFNATIENPSSWLDIII